MNGDPGQNNYIRLDPNASITVNKLGYVMQNNQIVGTIGMVDVDNYDYLEKITVRICITFFREETGLQQMPI